MHCCSADRLPRAPRRLLFSYEILTPAALNFFVSYADGAVESLWSIDQYFEFVLVLMLSTGLSFQVRQRWGERVGSCAAALSSAATLGCAPLYAPFFLLAKACVLLLFHAAGACHSGHARPAGAGEL